MERLKNKNKKWYKLNDEETSILKNMIFELHGSKININPLSNGNSEEVELSERR
jgi:hypothetical protein